MIAPGAIRFSIFNSWMRTWVKAFVNFRRFLPGYTYVIRNEWMNEPYRYDRRRRGGTEKLRLRYERDFVARITYPFARFFIIRWVASTGRNISTRLIHFARRRGASKFRPRRVRESAMRGYIKWGNISRDTQRYVCTRAFLPAVLSHTGQKWKCSL